MGDIMSLQPDPANGQVLRTAGGVPAAQVAPIILGRVTIETPVILAPMSGVTDMPFRRLVKQQGAGLVVSEMIASEAMVRESRRTLLMVSKSAEETPMAVQLAGCEPAVMGEAARLQSCPCHAA